MSPQDSQEENNDRPEYTPRKRLEGTLTTIEDRQSATRSMLSAGRKQPSNVTTYLQGYYDALELVTAELRKCKDAEIMGITPDRGDSGD